MRVDRDHSGLLVDFGGVLTTSVWDSFADFCREKGLEEDSIKRLFREDPAALADLRELETGRAEEKEFERRFAERLGLPEAGDLIDSMFRGMKPSEPMVAAVGAARAGGIRTGLVSNSWSTSHYDRALLAELFDAVVISAEVGLHKPRARDLPAGLETARRRARGVRVRRRPARELRCGGGSGHDRDTPPRRGRHRGAAGGAAGLHRARPGPPASWTSQGT